jgi:RNA polymerase sigma factor (sigma-70 family)
MTVGVVVPESKEEQFRSVYAKAYPAILSYVRRRLPPGQTSELDVASEIFAVVWRRFDDLPPPPEDVLWIYGVARNCVAHYHRDAARHSRLRARVAAEPALPAETDEADELRDVVRAAVERLPDVDREAIRLVHWEGLHHDEAAAVLGLSTNAVELRLRRARARLRRDLGALLDGGPTDEPSGTYLRSLPLEGTE